MDLAVRKYNFIQEVFNIDDDIFQKMETILKVNKTKKSEIPFDHKIELDKRLELYTENPNELIDWKTVKDNW